MPDDDIPPDHMLAFSATRERELRTWTTELMEQLKLPMVGLPSLKELRLSVDESILTDDDNFLFNRSVPDLVLKISRGFGRALSDGRLDHLTHLRLAATANQLVEISLSAARSKRLCENLRSLYCVLRDQIPIDEIRRETLFDDAVPELVKLCPNLQELVLDGVLTKLQLHPENKGLDKLILYHLSVPWNPSKWLRHVVARKTSVKLAYIQFRHYLGG